MRHGQRQTLESWMLHSSPEGGKLKDESCASVVSGSCARPTSFVAGKLYGIAGLQDQAGPKRSFSPSRKREKSRYQRKIMVLFPEKNGGNWPLFLFGRPKPKIPWHSASTAAVTAVVANEDSSESEKNVTVTRQLWA